MSEIQAWAGPVPSKGYDREAVPCLSLRSGGLLAILGMKQLHPDLCFRLHVVFSLSECAVCVQISLFHEAMSHTELEVHPSPV